MGGVRIERNRANKVETKNPEILTHAPNVAKAREEEEIAKVSTSIASKQRQRWQTDDSYLAPYYMYLV